MHARPSRSAWRNVRELAQANESLRRDVAERIASEEQRVRLLDQLVDAQEQERRRLARELREQFGQQVTALTLKVATLKGMRQLPPDLRGELGALESIAAKLDSDIERLAWELRPTMLDDLGLVEAPNKYIKTWTKQVGLKACLHARGFAGSG